MTNTVAVARAVDAPAEAVWRVVRSGGEMHRVLPGLIRSCRVDGDRRSCGTDQGAIEETLLGVDDEARLFRYRIDRQPLMPLTDYVGALHVVDLGDGRSHVLWFATFALVDEAAAGAVRSGLGDLFDAGIRGLAALAKEAA